MTESTSELLALLKAQTENLEKILDVENNLSEMLSSTKPTDLSANTKARNKLVRKANDLHSRIKPLLPGKTPFDESEAEKHRLKNAELLEQIHILSDKNLATLKQRREIMRDKLKINQKARQVAHGYKPKRTSTRTILDTEL